MEYIRVVGLQPDAVVYTALVHAYAEQGLWAEAEKTLRDMVDAGVMDDGPYAVLVAAYTKAGLYEEVNHVLQMMESDGVQPDTIFFNSLINVHSKSGAPEKALSVLQHMKDTGKSLYPNQ
jgi:pentatricopeptide repeat protein